MFPRKKCTFVPQISSKNPIDMNKVIKESVILGIDPGTNVLGYGILKVTNNSPKMEAMGVIDLRKCTDVYIKLGRIYERITSLIESFSPDELAIEAPFFGKNVQSMLKLGRAQGVVIAAAISKGIPVTEYAPLKIKLSITGRGQATKEQVSLILQRLLNINKSQLLPFLDSTDALAAAYCHYLQKSGPQEAVSNNKYSSWTDFVKKNEKRISKDSLSSKSIAKDKENI